MRSLLLAFLLLAAAPTFSQGSIVEPGPRQTLLVNGDPFYPLGWNMVGVCAAHDASPGTDTRGEIARTLETMREHGVNALFEAPFTSGRLIPRKSDGTWWNWYNYTIESEGETYQRGHARPGVYVEALDWLMDRASDSQEPMYTFVTLSSFITPTFEGAPHGGSDVLTCPMYRSLIEEERSHTARTDPARATRIPEVACEGQAARPFWEWNVWYIVHHLRDHPGLLGWYLVDEPEGKWLQYLYGLVEPHEPVRPYTGPASLPTPDLLRYTYDLVKAYETEGRSTNYQRHPILVDIYQPNTFFSRRFAWSRDGNLDPNWHAGPFDRRPDGSYRTPADLVGLDASNQMANPGSGQADGITLPLLGWWSDMNVVSPRAVALREVAERDGLWGALSIQAQAQLSGAGPFAVDEPLRCGTNDGQRRSRLLNDRDLIWNLMTLQVDGLRGQLYYAHSLLPEAGPGAEMERRINRLIGQFQEARFDEVLATPAVTEGWRLGPITVLALTNYYRSAPNFVGPADAFDAERATTAYSPERIAPSAYRAGRYGRSSEEATYGQPLAPFDKDTHFPEHRHLRVALHRLDGVDYLFLSNAYDARITADVLLDEPTTPPRIEEGQFDLDTNGTFAWRSSPDRIGFAMQEHAQRLRVDLEPYEVRVFRLP